MERTGCPLISKQYDVSGQAGFEGRTASFDIGNKYTLLDTEQVACAIRKRLSPIPHDSISNAVSASKPSGSDSSSSGCGLSLEASSSSAAIQDRYDESFSPKSSTKNVSTRSSSPDFEAEPVSRAVGSHDALQFVGFVNFSSFDREDDVAG